MELLLPKKWGEFEEISDSALPDSKKTETSFFQLQMHFDDPVEKNIANSDTTVSSESLGDMCRVGGGRVCTTHEPIERTV